MFQVKRIEKGEPWYAAGFHYAVVDTGFDGQQVEFICAFEDREKAELVCSTLNESAESFVGTFAGAKAAAA